MPGSACPCHHSVRASSEGGGRWRRLLRALALLAVACCLPPAVRSTSGTTSTATHGASHMRHHHHPAPSQQATPLQQWLQRQPRQPHGDAPPSSEGGDGGGRFKADWAAEPLPQDMGDVHGVLRAAGEAKQHGWLSRLLLATAGKKKPPLPSPPPYPSPPVPPSPPPPSPPRPQSKPPSPAPTSPSTLPPSSPAKPVKAPAPSKSPVKAPSPSPAVSPYYSTTYGQQGELWDPTDPSSRLIDWSYAGYSAGEQPLPNVPAACSVTDYGATGDGVTDDSQAFLAAIAATKIGAIYIPPGKYVLNTQLVITNPGVVLQGAGRNLTTLYFAKSLTDLFGQTWSGGDMPAILGRDASMTQSSWMNAPGLIRFLGPGPEAWQPLAMVVANAYRPGNTLVLNDTSQLEPGMWISLAQTDAGTNLRYDINMHPACLTAKCVSPGPGGVLRWHTRIASIAPGGVVTLERRLPFNVSAAWNATVYRYMAGLTEVGIEHLTIEMQWNRYKGHFLEDGWNGVEFSDVSQCWARNIAILNGDTLLSVYRTSFCTVTDIVTGVTAHRGPDNIDCHHGLNVSASQDILLSNVQQGITCYHDLTAYNYTVGVVFANATGVDVCMDHHRFYPFAVLWSNISLGAASRPFLSGGITTWGDISASFTTFWNVSGTPTAAPTSAGGYGYAQTAPPGYDMGPNVNFIGMRFNPTLSVAPAITKALNWHTENVPAQQPLVPGELYSAMLASRLAQPPPAWPQGAPS